MHIASTDHLPGHRITRYMGLVRGNTIRAKHVGRDIMAGLKSIVGGELAGYTEMLDEARDEAMNRLVSEAERLGANAIVGIRLTTSMVMQGASEVLVYGTAVYVEPE